MKPVRPVSLCTDKTLKVELKKENIEKNTPVLSISGRLTLHIIVSFFSIETEFESLSSVQTDPLLLMTHGYRATIVEANFCFNRISVFG